MIIEALHHTEFGREGTLLFPLFGTTIAVTMDDDVSRDYAEKCAQALLDLPAAVLDQLCEASVRYCEEFRAEIASDNAWAREHGGVEFELDIPVGVAGREILRYIQPNTLIVDSLPTMITAAGAPVRKAEDASTVSTPAPTAVSSLPGYSPDSVVIHLEANCDWEEEHGLEWLILDGKVLYVGPFEATTLTRWTHPGYADDPQARVNK